MLADNEKQYPAIRGLIIVVRLAAVVPTFFGIVTVFIGGAEQFRQKSGMLLIVAVIISVGPLVVGLILFAVGETLQLLVDIEANTRRSADEIATLPLALRSEDEAHSIYPTHR